MTIVVILSATRLLGEALQLLLSTEEGLRIAGHADQWRDAVTLIADAKPDVVLLDTAFARLEPPAAIRLVKQHSPQSRVLLLTGRRDCAEIRAGLKAGASGYVSKEGPLAELVRGIHAVQHGDVWIEPGVITALLSGDTRGRSGTKLTPREEEILKLLASGCTNRDIGRALHISEKTVKTHLNNVFRKLGVTRRVEAALYAVRTGLKGA
ncbi:MAG TPA: response regulator transcription factor [Methylomirabilota bacterium]|nr:response regulator transcription factor [Methylomirabilota bacterium]